MLVLTSFADDTDLSESPHEGTIILFLVRSYKERKSRCTSYRSFMVSRNKSSFLFLPGGA